MTILVLLAGLLASHFATGFVRVRDYRWLMQLVNWLRSLDGTLSWLPAAAVIAVAVIVGWLAGGLAALAWGTPGWMVLALLTVIYTLGPRDLDRDVRLVVAAEDTEQSAAARAALSLDETASGAQAGAAVLNASLARWFGIIFWFTLLGIPGALLYRLARVASFDPDMGTAERGRLEQLRNVLDWPVIALMLLAMALTADFDRIAQAWREYTSRWRMEPELFDRVAVAMLPDAEFTEGLDKGWRLAWRMLLSWLVVLSLLLLVGWLS